ncbi:MAG: DUF6265 family protein [Phycisphaerales bacterium JB054]
MPHLTLAAAIAWALTDSAGQPPAASPLADPAQRNVSTQHDVAVVASPTLTDLEFLAGAWEHDEDGTLVREVWDEPRGDAMVGHFVVVSEGSAVLYELFTVEQGEGAPVLRLRHFNRGLEPWASEADAPLTLTLTEADNRRAVFANPENDFPREMIYEVKDDTLTVSLIPAADSARGELTLEFTRVPHLGRK